MSRGGDKQAVNIKNLFDVYKKKLRAPQKTVVKTFQEVVGDLLHTEIKTESCEYSVSEKTLRLTVSGPLKTEILIRKPEILLHMKGRLGEKSAPQDII